MKRIPIPNTDLAVSPVCLGAADLGNAADDAKTVRLIDAYRDAGGNFLDTAHVYACWTKAGAGSSERAIARYIKAKGRGDLVVATKGGHPGMPGYRYADRYLDPCRLHADIQDSRGRLEVDHIDLYYLHRDDTRCPVGEIIDALDREIKSGSIRYIGASNWTPGRIRAANAYASSKGLAGFAVSQAEYSLAHRGAYEPLPNGAHNRFSEAEDLAFHVETGMPLCAYSSTARGYFSRDGADPAVYGSPLSAERRRRARKLAAAKGCTATQIALAWLMAQPFPCLPITGTTDEVHLKENLDAAAVALSPEEVRWLRAEDADIDRAIGP